jgi:uncharacterized integral membrane protein
LVEFISYWQKGVRRKKFKISASAAVVMKGILAFISLTAAISLNLLHSYLFFMHRLISLSPSVTRNAIRYSEMNIRHILIPAVSYNDQHIQDDGNKAKFYTLTPYTEVPMVTRICNSRNTK